MTVLDTDYSSYIYLFVCNNPTEDDQCEVMRVHSATREKVDSSLYYNSSNCSNLQSFFEKTHRYGYKERNGNMNNSILLQFIL